MKQDQSVKTDLSEIFLAAGSDLHQRNKLPGGLWTVLAELNPPTSLLFWSVRLCWLLPAHKKNQSWLKAAGCGQMELQKLHRTELRALSLWSWFNGSNIKIQSKIKEQIITAERSIHHSSKVLFFTWIISSLLVNDRFIPGVKWLNGLKIKVYQIKNIHLKNIY